VPGDVNGDGFADVIVGAESAAEGGMKRGAAYVVFGDDDLDDVSHSPAPSTAAT